MVRYCGLFNVFEMFSFKIQVPHVFSHSGIKVFAGFSVITNLAVTTHVTINHSKLTFFLK